VKVQESVRTLSPGRKRNDLNPGYIQPPAKKGCIWKTVFNLGYQIEEGVRGSERFCENMGRRTRPILLKSDLTGRTTGL